MMSSDSVGGDRRVDELADQLAAASDKNVPVLLLAIQDILDSVISGTQRAKKIKTELWNLDILPGVLLALQQDFSHIQGKWTTAASLTKILAHCAVSLDPADGYEYHGIFLPKAAERFLILSRNIQYRYIKIPENTLTLKDDLIRDFKVVIEALQWLISGHSFLTTNILRSNYLLQMLITDDKESSIVILGLFQSAVRINPDVLQTIDEKVVFSLLDEVIYKLSAFTDAEIGAAATRALVNISDLHPPLIRLLYTRYKGLRPLLSRWTGKGFGSDLKKLLLLLDSGSVQQAELKRLHHAARTIQAVWRGFRKRKQLKKANIAFTKLQKSFRAKQERRDVRAEKEREQRQLQYQLLISRRQAIRKTRQKLLDMVTTLDPGKVDKYLQMSQISATVKIQARWRGILERRKLGLRRATAHQVKAVIVIQRAVRRFLKKLKDKSLEPILFKPPPGLNDERRIDIQRQIDQHQELHPPRQMSQSAQQALHHRAQEMLAKYLSVHIAQRKSSQTRETLLASLQTDTDLLSDAPKLPNLTERDIHMFTSQTAPAAAKALANHKEQLLLVRQPWWRKLSDRETTDQEEGGYGEINMV